ncbi:MAG: hypothetical protein J2P45_31295, partial [Candidatus Dormibacteraeota bacterium]|nr:hypothetical protein [Candidatus Dormibacteraeota bacterium]
MAASPSKGPLPDDFAPQLTAILAPGQEDAASALIAEAARLEDDQLARFLEDLGERVSRRADPVSAAELDLLLAGARAGAARPRSSIPSSWPRRSS